MAKPIDRRILIIDDNPAIHQDFRKILVEPSVSNAEALDEMGAALFGRRPENPRLHRYLIDSAFQGDEGVEMIRQAREEENPYTMAFIDIRMPPGLDGIETIQKIIPVDPEIQLVLCSAYSDHSLDEIVARIGTTDRLLFMRKPFDPTAIHLLAIAMTEKWQLSREVASYVQQQSNCIVSLERVIEMIERENAELSSSKSELESQSNELSHRLQQRTIEILGTRDVTVFALAHLAESRDPETGDHLKRMREYAQIVAERLSLKGPYSNEIDETFLGDFYRSTPLHDIGKVGIPDQILLKPGALTAREFEIMKRHTLIGAEALEKASGHSPFGGFLKMASDIARYHHERFDGAGYPIGLKGTQIPLSARIAAIADVFDAITSNRVYRDAMPISEATSIIEADSGKHFDPQVVLAFQECLDDLLEVKAAVDSEKEGFDNLTTSIREVSIS